MKTDNAFIGYLRSHKEVFFFAFLLLLGMALFLLGSKDISGTKSGSTETSTSSVQSELEKLICEVEGVGDARVLLIYEDAETASVYRQSTDEESRTVKSVSVICDGGDNPQVQAQLTKMISSLFGIGANRVTVLKRKA